MKRLSAAASAAVLSLAAAGFSSPLKSAEGTGIPECDKYFAMVESCKPKMSKEEQQATQFNVQRLRTMLPMARAPQGREELVKRCTQSIEIGQKDDKHGCYASTR